MAFRGSIEELVRAVLGEAEIEPLTGSWNAIQRNLRWRQFTRFNPGRFNIFYAGGLLVAGAGIVAMLNLDRPVDPDTPVKGRTEITGQLHDRTGPGETGSPGSTDVTDQLHDAGGETGTLNNAGPGQVSNALADPEGSDPGPTTGPGPATEPGAKAGTTMDPSGTGGSGVDPGSTTDPVAGDIDPGPTTDPDAPGPTYGAGTLVAFFTPSVYSGCAPLEVTFFNCSVNALSARWDFGTGQTSSELNPDHTFHDPGSYTVTLTSEDSGGQPAVFRQVIEVHPAPRAEFEIEEGLRTREGVEELSLLNYSSGAVSYAWEIMNEEFSGRWSATSFQPLVRMRELDRGARRIRLVATSEFGCTDTLVRAIPETAGPAARQLQFPNAFSPNTTGPSGGQYSPHEKRIDVFHPVFGNVPSEYLLRIYNRRGELIFESRNLYEGWDGYYLQERSAGGVYVWMAEGSWPDGEEFSLQGDVTLIWGDSR